MTPVADIVRRWLAAPSHIDTKNVREQLISVAPLVVLELPCLTRRKNCDHAVPVLGLELLCALDQNEAHGSDRVDVPH